MTASPGATSPPSITHAYARLQPGCRLWSMRPKFRSENHCAFFAQGVANAEISAARRRRGRARRAGSSPSRCRRRSRSHRPRRGTPGAPRRGARRSPRATRGSTPAAACRDACARPAGRRRRHSGRSRRDRARRFGTPPSDVLTCTTCPVASVRRHRARADPGRCRADDAWRRARRGRRPSVASAVSSPAVTGRACQSVLGHFGSRCRSAARRACRAA